MTSFHGTAIRKHIAPKGMKAKTEALAAKRFGYLRVVTESRPHTQDTLKLRKGKGVKRDYSYINVKESFMIESRALALYGLKEEVDAYRLTAQAMKKLIDAVREKKALGKKVKLRNAKIQDAKDGKQNDNA